MGRLSAEPHEGSGRAFRGTRHAILRRLFAEFGPLLVFFAAFKAFDFMVATAVFLAAVAAVTISSWVAQRRLPILPVFGLLVTSIAGALTLALDSEFFMKLRPTVVNGLYGAACLLSLVIGRPALKTVLGGPLDMDSGGWRGLTLMTGLYLTCLAALNELVWRTQPTTTWVDFKVFGIIPLDMIFALAMWPYIRRHHVRERELVRADS